MNYIANLLALRQWYCWVRALFISEQYPKTLAVGLTDTLELAINERIEQLQKLCRKMPISIEGLMANATPDSLGPLVQQQQELYDRRKKVEIALQRARVIKGDIDLRDSFLESVSTAIKAGGNHYITAIQALKDNGRKKVLPGCSPLLIRYRKEL